MKAHFLAAMAGVTVAVMWCASVWYSILKNLPKVDAGAPYNWHSTTADEADILKTQYISFQTSQGVGEGRATIWDLGDGGVGVSFESIEGLYLECK